MPTSSMMMKRMLGDGSPPAADSSAASTRPAGRSPLRPADRVRHDISRDSLAAGRFPEAYALVVGPAAREGFGVVDALSFHQGFGVRRPDTWRAPGDHQLGARDLVEQERVHGRLLDGGPRRDDALVHEEQGGAVPERPRHPAAQLW